MNVGYYLDPISNKYVLRYKGKEFRFGLGKTFRDLPICTNSDMLAYLVYLAEEQLESERASKFEFSLKWR